MKRIWVRTRSLTPSSRFSEALRTSTDVCSARSVAIGRTAYQRRRAPPGRGRGTAGGGSAVRLVGHGPGVISRHSFVSLKHRNFRLIWIGLMLSFTGSMMQNAALLWHVSLLVAPERKGLALGMVGLVKVVPIVVFSLISGVVADAWDRRKLMLLTQVGATAVALGL